MEYIGKRFGNLTVLEYTGRIIPKKGKELLCQCDCGNKITSHKRALRVGDRKSCGCLRSRLKDLTGQRFGRLLVLEYDKEKKKWKCQCDCGNTTYSKQQSLIRKEKKSCGCLQHKREDLTGQRFNKLIALNYVGSDNSGSKWRCKCDCGNITIVSLSNLKRGKKSCGCWNGNNPEITLSNHLYASYRWGANKRSLSFQISKDSFRSIIKKDCYYCGQPPSQIKTAKNNPYSMKYNGVDRLDNSRGYEEDNVVPCCKRCNSMKSNLDSSDFLAHMIRILKNQRKKGLV